jgi:quercetin dioxygenase-like cupin family protein
MTFDGGIIRPCRSKKAVASPIGAADNGADQKKELTMRVRGALIALAVAGAAAGAWAQQAPTFKRTVLQQVDISVPGREAVTALVEFQPNGTSGRHSHPGEEIGYILDGTFVLEQDGKPPVTLKAGGTFLIPPGAIHSATNMGAGGRVLATYVVEKGKPMATPAPAK